MKIYKSMVSELYKDKKEGSLNILLEYMKKNKWFRKFELDNIRKQPIYMQGI